MATTNSKDHNLNYYMEEGSENSGVKDWIVTNTGSKKRKNGLPVLNNEFELSSVAGASNTSDINSKLLDWNDAVKVSSDEILASPGLSSDKVKQIVFESWMTYEIIGHPDKWVYDYSQKYNNCGVDSCLNILSMAGVKDIVERGSSYETYLNTPTVKTKTKTYYDEEAGEWKTEKYEETTYPTPKDETEDDFLLWAIKNSPNDSDWYKKTYSNTTNQSEYSTVLGTDDITDYVIHAKNYTEYNSKKDLEEATAEIGGTTATHRNNILNAWGVKSSIHTMQINYLQEIENTSPDPVTSVKYEDGTDGTTKKRITTVTKTEYGKYGQSTTITETVTTEYVQVGEAGKESEWKLVEGTKASSTVTKTEIYEKNTTIYNYLGELCKLVDEGRGVILSGYAETFKGGTGGPHAITLVGVAYGNDQPLEKVTVKVDDGEEKVVKNETSKEIIGVYVIDSGGWLTNGLTTERAQFISCSALYEFLTNATYSTQEAGGGAYTYLNVTDNEIRSWADNLNIVGNNRKNILEGNESQNYIYGGKGNDVLYGRGGNDYLYGDEDNDTLYGGQGNDVLTGGKGNDLYVFQGYDFMDEHATNDIKTAKGSHDYLVVGQGSDEIQFDSIIEYQDGQPNGNSTVITPIEDMKYQNRDGNLVITYTITKTYNGEVTYNNNSITIKDYFSKKLYNTIKTIKESKTVLEYGVPTQKINDETSFNLYNHLKNIQVDYYAKEDTNNTLKGTDLSDFIVGGNKNDVITGGKGKDTINGGASDDTIKAGADNDLIYGSYGNDKIYGEAGDDTISYKENYGGHDTIYSGSGVDTIELYDYSRSDLLFTKANKDLVITYDRTKGGSITISNYFGKKGNTSIKYLELANGSDTISLQTEYSDILQEASILTPNDPNNPLMGTNGYDKITGTNGDDYIAGGLGHDTLYGGNGDDTLNGGLGSDMLYGQGGNNTYIFDSKALGQDTIYTSGNGKSILDFTGSGINFGSIGADGVIDEYSFTKVKNDLWINYAMESDFSDSDNALIKISGFFNSKGDFEIINSDGSTLDIKNQAAIYFNGVDSKANKITGSNYNDLIVGYEYNDTLNGGKGNDTLIGGKGNDVLTGGAGSNTIKYAKGDGFDTINLTKGENLSIDLSGFDVSAIEGAETKIFDYNIVKNDLVISYIDEDGEKTDLLKLKNFGSKDVTTASGSVKLYNDGTEIMDLRLGNYLDKYIDFTPKSYKYTGKWQSEVIDARALNAVVVSKDRGANINAKAGNDTIYGSDYNDTINGGDGDDVIWAGYGKNTVNGGNGNDTYYLFDSISASKGIIENTTIKDTGKGDNDTAVIHVSSLDELRTKDSNIWFNIKSNGQYSTTFNVTDANKNKATITGVEEIVIKTDSNTYKYNYEELVSDVVSWLSTNGYKDVSQVMKSYDANDMKELIGIFTSAEYFTDTTV